MKFLIKTICIVFITAGFVAIMNFCSKEESVLPVVLTIKVSGITTTTAVSGGNITSDGGAPLTSKGVCWNTLTDPTVKNYKTTDGEGAGIYSSNLTNLESGTIYYVRAYATNKAGTTYGFETAFTTIPITPSLTTIPASEITTNSATSGGIITSDGGFSVTARGVCWSNSDNPTLKDPHTSDSTGTGSFTSCLTGLSPDTSYFVRAYASNSGGTAYGYEIRLQTLPHFSPIVFNPHLTYDSISDIDRNIYKTIKIGTQTWMAENLKTTKYNDGTPIPDITDDSIWYQLSTPAYCWLFNNESIFKDMYGAIYNYYAVETGKICPTGWHVSSTAEWDTLASHLGGREIAGGRLKESGITHWKTPNTGADNISGFTALPGGYRYFSSFSDPEYRGRWWCSDLWAMRELQYDTNILDGASCNSTCGYSVRCVKDN